MRVLNPHSWLSIDLRRRRLGGPALPPATIDPERIALTQGRLKPSENLEPHERLRQLPSPATLTPVPADTPEQRARTAKLSACEGPCLPISAADKRMLDKGFVVRGHADIP